MSRPARPLRGRTIVVTRPSRQAQALSGMIEEAGGSVLRFPLIEIEPASGAELDAVIESIGSFDLAIFVSRNAVEQGLSRVSARRAWPATLPTAAVGSGTRRALEAHGLGSVISPEGLADSEGLLDHPGLSEVSGKRIVIFRGIGGRELLAARLRARGARVEYAECYRRKMPESDSGPLVERLAARAVDAVIISSGEGLENLARILGESAAGLGVGVALLVPHPRVARQAADLGFANVRIGGPGDEDMFVALVAYFCNAG